MSGTFRIVYAGDTYCGQPESLAVPAGWAVLRGGFASLCEAQAFLSAEVDAIPEGFGLPTAESLANDAACRRAYGLRTH
jgi:hypothetical protein